MAGKAWGILGLLLIVGVVPLTAASPGALETKVVSVAVDPTTGSTRGGYANAVAVVDVAGKLTLLNADLTAHDIISEEIGPVDNPWCARYAGHHECPLFASPIVGLGGEAVVEGTDQLEPGTTYPFYCSIHHWMTGILVAI